LFDEIICSKGTFKLAKTQRVICLFFCLSSLGRW